MQVNKSILQNQNLKETVLYVPYNLVITIMSIIRSPQLIFVSDIVTTEFSVYIWYDGIYEFIYSSEKIGWHLLQIFIFVPRLPIALPHNVLKYGETLRKNENLGYQVTRHFPQILKWISVILLSLSRNDKISSKPEKKAM